MLTKGQRTVCCTDAEHMYGLKLNIGLNNFWNANRERTPSIPLKGGGGASSPYMLGQAPAGGKAPLTLYGVGCGTVK